MQTINDLFDNCFICDDVERIANTYKLPVDVVGLQYTKTLLRMSTSPEYMNMPYDTFKTNLVSMTKNYFEARRKK